MQQIFETNGNGYPPIPSLASPNDPVEAANILKVYYSELLAEAQKIVTEKEAELAKICAKRDALKELAEQAEQMLQGIKRFQQIGTGTEEVSLPPDPAPVSHLPIPDELLDELDMEEADFDIYVAEEDSVKEEPALVLNEDEIPNSPPLATIIVDSEGGVKAKMLPRFNGMTKTAAITQILEENSDRVMHRASVMEEMHGRIEDKEVRKIIVSRVGAALTAGRVKEIWYADPHNEGFYTANQSLIKGKRKTPR